MNRRKFIHTTTLAAAGSFVAHSAFANHDGKVGTFDLAAWQKLNAEAGEKLKALRPTPDKLSEDDQKLLIEVATGGSMQLELSKAALSKARSADVKAYAQAEVDEQTGLAAKLAEIAAVKMVTLPAVPDEATRKAVEKLKGESDAKADHEYLQEGGVDGHEKLEKTMHKVQNTAKDATLKELAAIALPLIKTHLQAAKDEMKDKG